MQTVLISVLTSGFVSALFTAIVTYKVERFHRNQDLRVSGYADALVQLDHLGKVAQAYWSSPQEGPKTPESYELLLAWYSFNAIASALAPQLDDHLRFKLQEATTGGDFGEERAGADEEQCLSVISAISSMRATCQRAKIEIVRERPFSSSSYNNLFEL